MLEPAEPGRGVGRRSASALLAMAGCCSPRRGCRAPRRVRGASARHRPAGDPARAPGRPASPPSCCCPATGASWPPASRAASATCPACACPTAASTSGSRLVIPLGGTVLVVLAALLAFWPRRSAHRLPDRRARAARDALRRAGRRARLRGRVPARRAAALLVLAFLRLEKLRLPDGRRRPRCSRVGVAVAALIVAPALNRDTPWCDYETWALDTAASKSTSFTWNHDYGPLDWPRDGRELLRVKAKQPAYWKAENLDVFDGGRWLRVAAGTREASTSSCPADCPPSASAGRRRSRSRSATCARDQFITAGSRRRRRHAAAATRSRRVDGHLQLAAARCAAATPTRPTSTRRSPTEQRAARGAAPTTTATSTHYLTLDVLDPSCGRPPARRSARSPVDVPGVGARRRAPTWSAAARRRRPIGISTAATELARASARAHLRARAAPARRRATPDDYVQRVSRPTSAATASPTPSRRRATARTLDGFLFDAKTGYCQQFSGAMALLLRMGGIPARVATGFTPGALRPQDAASTSCATSTPTRGSRPGSRATAGSRSTRRRPPRRRARQPPTRPAPPAAAPGDGRRASAATGASEPRRAARAAADGRARGGAAALAGVGAARRARRWLGALAVAPPAPRRAARALAELERALRAHAAGSRPPGTTLQRARAPLRRARPPPPGYVRALREQRYRDGRARRPTRAQRRGLRSRARPRAAGSRGRLRALVGAAAALTAPAAAPTLESDGRRLRPLPARHGAARGRATSTRRPSRWRRPATSSPTRPRSARRSAGRYFRSRQLRGGARGVRGGRRARADQRLRAVLPRPRADAARPPAEARKPLALAAQHAPRAARLPHLPRPRARKAA